MNPWTTYTVEQRAEAGEWLVLIAVLLVVLVVAERVQYYGKDGKLITESLKGCVEQGRPPLKHRLFLGMIGLTGGVLAGPLIDLAGERCVLAQSEDLVP